MQATCYFYANTFYACLSSGSNSKYTEAVTEVCLSLKSRESVSLQNVGTLLLQNLCRAEGSLWITHSALWAVGFPDRNRTVYKLIVGSNCEMRDDGIVLHSFTAEFGSVEYFMLYT